MNSAQRPIDCKREEYRKYLERTGVLEALTKTLASLYEVQEKPTDALSYLYTTFHDSFPDKKSSKVLEAQLAEANAKIEALTKELAATQTELAAFKREEEKAEEAMLEDTPDVPSEAAAPAALPMETTPTVEPPVEQPIEAAVEQPTAAAVEQPVTSETAAPPAPAVEAALDPAQ